MTLIRAPFCGADSSEPQAKKGPHLFGHYGLTHHVGVSGLTHSLLTAGYNLPGSQASLPNLRPTLTPPVMGLWGLDGTGFYFLIVFHCMFSIFFTFYFIYFYLFLFILFILFILF